MRIAFFGSSLTSAYWNGAATYYRGLIRALHGRGHRVTFFEPDAFGRQAHRDMEDPDWAEVVVYPATPAGVELALTRASAADVVIKASGVGVFDVLLEEEVAGLSGPARLTAFWDVDAPATLARIAADPLDPARACIPRYDLVLTYGGGPPVSEAYRRLGARCCQPIYNALDPATHYPVSPAPLYAADLTFLGNRLPDREARVAEFFVRPAALLAERSFLLGGSGWDELPLPANVRQLGHVSTREHNALNSTPLAVLNVCREAMACTGWSPATRVFEAVGAGACLISDVWAGMEEFLEPGREVLLAGDGEQVASLLSGLTRDRARRIGAAARRRVLAEHTYDHRAVQVEAALDGHAARGAA